LTDIVAYSPRYLYAYKALLPSQARKNVDK
jgi:hypothetical protein